MNGFEAHGIDRTSPSQENMWTDAPDAWLASYLFGRRGQMGVAAARGQAVESAVAAILRGASVQTATDVVLQKFDEETCFSIDDTKSERACIEPMIGHAMAALIDHGSPDDTGERQEMIEFSVKGNGWELPGIGYLDFRFSKVGEVVDLKTTKRMPSVMSLSHQRQRCLYQGACGNFAVRFLYVTPKGFAWKQDGDVAETLAAITTQVARRERFLSVGDKETLRSIVPVNTESFYWRGNEAARRDLFGL